MLLCLDYDGTYTNDPPFWDRFITLSRDSGHTVICATMRFEMSEGESVKLALGKRVSAIYFTSRKAKKPFLEKLGIHPDIWIDDTPEWLLRDALA